jgi:hypothetical protein
MSQLPRPLPRGRERSAEGTVSRDVKTGPAIGSYSSLTPIGRQRYSSVCENSLDRQTRHFSRKLPLHQLNTRGTEFGAAMSIP